MKDLLTLYLALRTVMEGHASDTAGLRQNLSPDMSTEALMEVTDGMIKAKQKAREKTLTAIREYLDGQGYSVIHKPQPRTM